MVEEYAIKQRRITELMNLVLDEAIILNETLVQISYRRLVDFLHVRARVHILICKIPIIFVSWGWVVRVTVVFNEELGLRVR